MNDWHLGSHNLTVGYSAVVINGIDDITKGIDSTTNVIGACADAASIWVEFTKGTSFKAFGVTDEFN